MREFDFISYIQAQFPPRKGSIGIGDDCAFIPFSQLGTGAGPGGICISVDSFVGGRHFLTEKLDLEFVGSRSCRAALSDLAASGSTPHSLFINLQLPGGCESNAAKRIYDGVHSTLKEFGVDLLGGNMTEGECISLTITVLGSVKNFPMSRASAEAGDDLWISGAIGGSGVGVREILARTQFITRSEKLSPGLEQHLNPIPRLKLGEALVRDGLSKCAIDISDGLLQDVQHIAEQSKKGIEIDLSAVPFHQAVASDLKSQLVALTAGEDYELAFTSRPSVRGTVVKLATEAGCALTLIGSVTGNEFGQLSVRHEGQSIDALDLLEKNGLARQLGFQHFSGREQ